MANSAEILRSKLTVLSAARYDVRIQAPALPILPTYEFCQANSTLYRVRKAGALLIRDLPHPHAGPDRNHWRKRSPYTGKMFQEPEFYAARREVNSSLMQFISIDRDF